VSIGESPEGLTPAAIFAAANPNKALTKIDRSDQNIHLLKGCRGKRRFNGKGRKTRDLTVH
jgi:hypothetical protein